jgi:hypothetical protein
VLVQVKDKCERSLLVRPPSVEKTSRLHSRDPVASGGQVRAAWWQEQQDEIMDGFLVEPQNKVEPGLRGSRVMSGDWQRLDRLRRVSGGSPENHWVPWLIYKAKTEEPKTEVQQHRTDRTGGSDRSD